MLKAVLVLLTFSACFAAFAVNAGSQLMTMDIAHCLTTNKVTGVTTNALTTNGDFDDNFSTSFKNLREGGIADLQATVRINDKFVPENICDTLGGISAVFKGTIWFVIDPAYWGATQVGKRIEYLGKFISACKAQGVPLGIFSSAENWTKVFGDKSASSSALNELPLWYSNYNGLPNYSDFDSVKFGGWTKPTKKEFLQNGKLCGKTFGFDF